MLCAKCGWNWPSGSGEEDFLISSMYFRYFIITSPWKRTGLIIWTILNPLHPTMICAKFGWSWSTILMVSEKKIFIIVHVFAVYFLFSLRDKCGRLFYNKTQDKFNRYFNVQLMCVHETTSLWTEYIDIHVLTYVQIKVLFVSFSYNMKHFRWLKLIML